MFVTGCEISQANKELRQLQQHQQLQMITLQQKLQVLQKERDDLDIELRLAKIKIDEKERGSRLRVQRLEIIKSQLETNVSSLIRERDGLEEKLRQWTSPRK